jgi:lipopolysaccharide transport system permease protein
MPAFVTVLGSLHRDREFIFQMARREMRILFSRSAVGIGWLVIRPFIQSLTYVAVVWILSSATLTDGTSPANYAVYVLAGTAAWQISQRQIEDASGLIRDRAEMITQSNYPLASLPLQSLAATLIGPVVSLVVCVAFVAGTSGLTWNILLLPVAVALIVLFGIGLSWILMIAGYFLRDLKDILGVTLGLAVFVSPVMLTPEMIGPDRWWLIGLNPLSHPVLCVRDAILGTFHPQSWAILAAMAAAMFVVGARAVLAAKLAINRFL